MAVSDCSVQTPKKEYLYIEYHSFLGMSKHFNGKDGIFMSDLIVKPVDVLGDTVMAARDSDGVIWVGIKWICQGMGMSDGHYKRQIKNIQKDLLLKNSGSNLILNKGSGEREVFCLKLDYLPIWLAKISITPTIQKDHPELADKLLEYQLKAKDILAAAFLPQQESTKDIHGQIKLLAQGTDELYQRVDEVNTKVNGIKEELETFKLELPLFPEDADEVRRELNKKVVSYLGGKDSNAYRDRSIQRKAFIDAYRELKRNFDVSSYKSIKRNQKARALQVIEAYKPPVVLLDQIEQCNAQQHLELKGNTNKT